MSKGYALASKSPSGIVLFANGEIVRRIVNCWLSVRTVDLVLTLSPLRVVDAVDPLLRLEHNTAVFLNICLLAVRAMLLTGLDRNGTVLADTVVDLHALLIGTDVHLDAGGW